MDFIESLPLDRIICRRQWAFGPRGSLLQVRARRSGGVVVAMQCQSKDGGPCLLVLSSLEKGTLVKAGFFEECALDVSDLLELHVEGAGPFPFSEDHAPLFGVVCLSGDGRLFVRASLGEQRQCVWIDGKDFGIVDDMSPGGE